MYKNMMIIQKYSFLAMKKTKQLTSSVVHWPYKVSLSRICFSSTFYIQPNKHRRNRAAVGQTSYHPTWFFPLQLTIINQLPSNGSNLRTLVAWQLVFILIIIHFSLFLNLHNALSGLFTALFIRLKIFYIVSLVFL